MGNSSDKELAQLGEFGLIDLFKSQLPPLDDSVVVGIGDDAAVLSYPSSTHVLMTTDMLVDGVHFSEATMPPRQVGWKSIVASVSDIAAMGGTPAHAVISIAIPPSASSSWLQEVYRGIAEAGQQYGVHIVGGDTVKTADKLVISVTLTGRVPVGQAILRSGARVGDVVFVGNWVGGSAAGLDWLLAGRPQIQLQETEQTYMIDCHQHPEPQTEFGRILGEKGWASSLNDISDGLASELNELAEASGVSIIIDEQAIPIHPVVRAWALQSGQDALDWALYGGEDYQLVGTCSPDRIEQLLAVAQSLGHHPKMIGQVVAVGSDPGKPGVWLQRSSGTVETVTRKGYNHFAEVGCIQRELLDEVATRTLAEKLAQHARPGIVITLEGDLGAGKTTFTQAFAKGLGITEPVQSPTFVLIREYQGRLPLYHMDVYRLGEQAAEEPLDFEEYFYGDGVTVVEWAHFLEPILPADHIAITIKVTGESNREITIDGTGPTSKAILEEMQRG